MCWHSSLDSVRFSSVLNPLPTTTGCFGHHVSDNLRHRRRSRQVAAKEIEDSLPAINSRFLPVARTVIGKETVTGIRRI